MRSYRTVIISAVVAAALAVPVCTTFAKTPKTVVADSPLSRAQDVFPFSKYVNIYNDTDATGDSTVSQEASAKYMTLDVSASNLIPNHEYRVYYDRDGITPGSVSTAGPCTLIGTVTTDSGGNLTFNWSTAPGDLATGTYTWAVYINRTEYTGTKLVVNNTVLIGGNLSFQIK